MTDLLKILKDKAKEKKRRIIICEGWDERVLKAADEVVKEGLADVVLIDKDNQIKDRIKELGLSITEDDVEIIPVESYDKKQELAKKLYELRKHKGITEEQALKMLDDINYLGTMLLYTDYVDGMASSCICPTENMMRPVLQIIKTKEGCSLVSEVSVLTDNKTGRVLFATDGSLNIEPDSEQLAQMAINAAECAKNFKAEPYVAMLSFATKSEQQHPVLEHVRKAVAVVKERAPDIKIDGELQFDAAINPDKAKKKCPDSEVGGKANVLVFPGLTSANIFMHGMMQFAPEQLSFDFTFLMGVKKPVSILGRGSTAEMIRNFIISTAAQANWE